MHFASEASKYANMRPLHAQSRTYEGTNDHPRKAGRPHDLYDDSDTAEESQAEDSLPGFTAEDQRCTAGYTDGSLIETAGQHLFTFGFVSHGQSLEPRIPNIRLSKVFPRTHDCFVIAFREYL